MNRDIYLWLSLAFVGASLALSAVDLHERAGSTLIAEAAPAQAAVVSRPGVSGAAGAVAFEPPVREIVDAAGDGVENADGVAGSEGGGPTESAGPVELVEPMESAEPAKSAGPVEAVASVEFAAVQAVEAVEVAEPFARANDEMGNLAPATADAAAGELAASVDADRRTGEEFAREFAPPPEIVPAALAADAATPLPLGEAAPDAVASASPTGPSSVFEDEATAAALRTALEVTAPEHSGVRRARAASQWARRIGEDVDKELKCLALNIYWEARSEPTLGRFAVAAVTLNRVGHKGFPDTVCGVVHQGAERGLHRCQFSWVCDGKTKAPGNPKAWREAEHIAYTMVYLDLPDPTDGALWYHADYVSPGWAKAMARVTQIGRHIYYRGVIRTADGSERAAG